MLIDFRGELHIEDCLLSCYFVYSFPFIVLGQCLVGIPFGCSINKFDFTYQNKYIRGERERERERVLKTFVCGSHIVVSLEIHYRAFFFEVTLNIHISTCVSLRNFVWRLKRSFDCCVRLWLLDSGWAKKTLLVYLQRNDIQQTNKEATP